MTTHELATKLRKWADWLDFDIGTDYPAGKDLREAADTIDRLTSTGEAVAWMIVTGEEGGGAIFETDRWHAEQAAKDGRKVTPLYTHASPREGHVEVPDGMVLVPRELVTAAMQMPRKTPAPGGAATLHSYTIEAGVVWELDRALQKLAALPQNQGETKP